MDEQDKAMLTAAIRVFIIMLFFLLLAFVFSRGSKNNTNTIKPIPNIKGQQQQLTDEINTAGYRAAEVKKAISGAEAAIDKSSATADDIQGCINRAEHILRECREITESNKNILEGATTEPGEGTPTRKGN